MPKRAAAEIPADGERCERNDGRRWRCSLRRFGESRFCEKHHAYFLKKNADARSGSRVRVGILDSQIKKTKVKKEETDSVENEKKKKRKKTRGIGVRVSGTPSIEKEMVSVGISEPSIQKRRSCAVGRPAKRNKLGKIEMNGERGKSPKAKEMEANNGVRVSGKKRHGKTPEMKNVDRDEEKRVVRVIELGQIWAFSKEADGFPRCYARIDRIFPIPPVVRATPLIFHPISHEEMFLSEQGFSLACGMYRFSESSCIKEISAFTHQVVADMEGMSGCFYKVYPKKGDIWAIYTKLDITRKAFKYKLVEIASDFSEVDGVDGFGLIKVEGTNNQVYKRQEYGGFYLVRGFKRECMTMFSHQIPATRVVEGDEVLWKLHSRGV